MNIDPRGIRRKITSAEWRCDGSHIEFECGHSTKYPPHFAASEFGTEAFCYQCGQEAKAGPMTTQDIVARYGLPNGHH